MASWPGTVPHKPQKGSLRIDGAFREPHTTDLEDGVIRQRRATTKNIATITFDVVMTAAEYFAFKVWVRDTLVDGTLPVFTAPVWTGSSYETRNCTFRKRYSAVFVQGDRYVVAVELDVEDY